MIHSIGMRLAVWYAFAATITLACLFVVGYELLRSRLVHGLDLLNEAEARQIRSHLGPDYASLDIEAIDQRIRETTESASVLFYINVHNTSSNILFYSHNLNGVAIPDVRGERIFDTVIDGVGPVRVGEVVLDGLDIVIATPSTQVNATMRDYVEVCAALLLAMLLVSMAIGYGLSRLALRPVRTIAETARRIGSDNLGERMPVGEVRDEISDLARLLNEMFDRLETSFNQIRRFTAEASHELKTPLALARLHAEKLIVDGRFAPAQEEGLQILLEEIGHLDHIIDQLLFLSRVEAKVTRLDLVAQDPSAFLRGFAPDASVLVEHRGLRFRCDHEGAGTVRFAAKWIRQVLLNLISNAIKASPAHGLIELQSTLADGVWRVAVIDQGRGLPPTELERIFERFVRVQGAGYDDGKSSGLGLSICRSIVGLHGGHIRAENGAAGSGLRVIFEIPE
ncbi:MULTISPECIES: ATP-binding protein [unclassified Rudaea]|uniref:HAMP domain-containing sensor histidine kinase n=1 Tax=unclassified Rudaea TaxID=2627037 RepID=UPI002016611D|nr:MULTISPECIES: ATP-binding protein [unclassified Rudaea]